jgi:hypothetical protein
MNAFWRAAPEPWLVYAELLSERHDRSRLLCPRCDSMLAMSFRVWSMEHWAENSNVSLLVHAGEYDRLI